MSILAWIVLGIIAGFVGSKLVNKTGEGLMLDLVLGIVGAIVGGWMLYVLRPGRCDRAQSLQPPGRRDRCRCRPARLSRDHARHLD